MHFLWERARIDTLNAHGFMQASGSKTLASTPRTKPHKHSNYKAQFVVILQVCIAHSISIERLISAARASLHSSYLEVCSLMQQQQ